MSNLHSVIWDGTNQSPQQNINSGDPNNNEWYTSNNPTNTTNYNNFQQPQQQQQQQQQPSMMMNNNPQQSFQPQQPQSNIGAGFNPSTLGSMQTSMKTNTGTTAYHMLGGEPDFSNEPPLLEEIGVNFSHIKKKTIAVLLPAAQLEKKVYKLFLFITILLTNSYKI